MFLNFSKLGYESIEYLLIAYNFNKPVSFNIFNTTEYSNELLTASNNFSSFNYQVFNAYDYIFFSDNYYNIHNNFGRWIYDEAGFLIRKFGFETNGKAYLSQMNEVHRDLIDNNIYSPNLKSFYNSYGTREGQMVTKYDAHGRIIQQSWEFYQRKPSKKNIFLYTKDQEYIIKIYATEDSYGDRFSISKLDLYKTNTHGKIRSHYTFKVRNEYNDIFYKYLGIELTEYITYANITDNKINIKKHELTSESKMKIIESSRKEMIKIDGWSDNDLHSFFQEVINFVNVKSNELNVSKEISEEYNGKNLDRRSIIENDKELTYDFIYTFNENKDWITKKCLYKEDKITEEIRGITYQSEVDVNANLHEKNVINSDIDINTVLNKPSSNDSGILIGKTFNHAFNLFNGNDNEISKYDHWQLLTEQNDYILKNNFWFHGNEEQYYSGIKLLDEIIDKHKYLYVPYLFRALAYIKNKEYEKAENDLRSASDISPNNHIIYNIIGYNSLVSNNFYNAETHFERANRMWPNHHITLFNLGITKLLRWHTNDANNYFNQAIELNPNNADVYFCKGISILRTQKINSTYQDLDLAKYYFEEAVRLDVFNIVADTFRMKCNINKGFVSLFDKYFYTKDEDFIYLRNGFYNLR